jgi:hypothetical protein
MLTRGDKGEAVKDLQRGLNRLGSMLLVDGDFGPSTEAAVVDARGLFKLPAGVNADDALMSRLAGLPEPSVELTSSGVTFIAREEVSSPAQYRSRFSRPVWPTAPSGITIGIGYDLKFVNRAKLLADWSEVLSVGVIDRLAAVSGTAGSAEKVALVKDVEIPLLAAIRVFLGRMMPEHIGHTRQAFPVLDTLPAHRRTALISLVFNRGASLDPSDDRRREMRRIRDLLSTGELERIPEQFESMTRLWNPATEQGVIDRRRREAQIWRDGFAALQLL